MPESTRKNYLTLADGGLARRKNPRTLTPVERDALDRRMHDAYVSIYDDAGHVPSMGLQDCRQHKQHPHRVIARRLAECGREELALRIVDELRGWVKDYYRGSTPHAA